MIKIFHNNRCRKSREGLALIEASKQDFEIVNYLENPPTSLQLIELLNMLGMQPHELLRKNEAIWKEKYKGKTLSDSEIIAAMSEHPKLIERPIVVKGNKAVLGRPASAILKIL